MPGATAPISRRGILGGIGASYLQAAVSIVVTFVSTPLFLAGLGAETYGLFLATSSWVAYLALFRAGFPQAAGNQMAAAVAQSQPERAADVLRTSLWLSVFAALGGALVLALLVATGVISPRLFKGSDEVARLAMPLLLTSAAGFLIALPLQQYSAGLRALRLVHQEQLVQAAVRVLGLAGGVAVLALGLGAVVFAASQASITVLAGLLCALLVARSLGGELRAHARFRGDLARGLLNPGLHFLLLALSGALIWGTSNIIISMFESAAAVTPYAVTFRLIFIPITWLTLGIGALGPTVTSLWVSGQLEQLERLLLELLKLGMAGAVLVGIGLGFFGRSFVRLWAGPEAVASPSVMWTFVAILVVVSCTTCFELLLIATSRHERYAQISLAEGLMNLTLSLLLIRPLGTWGVALATLLAHLMGSAWFVPRSVTRMLSLPWRRVFREAFAPMLFPAAASLTCAALCASAIDVDDWLAWALCAGGSAACFVIPYALFGLNTWERQNARRLVGVIRERWPFSRGFDGG
jgi:O-antigen/teichoic acid export membrane protein